jgi:GcrA cell cycle regulator
MITHWDATKRALLADLWGQSLSSKEIAAQVNLAFGCEASSRSVLHTAWRMGLPRRHAVSPTISKWAEPTIARLAALRTEGLSSSQIATVLNAELGLSLTRNAVIGRLARSGLSILSGWRGGRKAASQRIKKPRQRKKLAAEIIEFRRKEAPDIVDAQIPVEQRKSLINLGPRDCRWPVGEPQDADFFFCGAASDDGCSYCPSHTWRSIEPRKERSRAA